MNRSPVSKRLLRLFFIVLAGYMILFALVENRRRHNGPWQVTFATDNSLTINQPKLGITNVTLAFLGEHFDLTNSVAMEFTQPIGTPFEVPFGKCIFIDLVTLPGTVVFEISLHQVQLMPRVLTIDGQEVPWKSNSRITLPSKTHAP